MFFFVSDKGRYKFHNNLLCNTVNRKLIVLKFRKLKERRNGYKYSIHLQTKIMF